MRDGGCGGRLGCLVCPGCPGGLGWECRGPAWGSICWAFERLVPRRLQWQLGCSVGRWSIDCEGGGTCGVPRGAPRLCGWGGLERIGPGGYLRCITSPWCSDGKRLRKVAGRRVVFTFCGLLGHGAGRWWGKAIGPAWVGRGIPGERRRRCAKTCFPVWPLGSERGRLLRGAVVGRHSWGRWFRRLGTGGMCSWGSLVGCRRTQGTAA
jgi:hypothetical protein